MIKILKEGIIKPTKTIYTAKCTHCSCEFEFEAEDAIKTEIRPDGIAQLIHIKCPYCKKAIILSRPWIETREEEIEE